MIYRSRFLEGRPFPHIVIDDLWPKMLLEKAAAEFEQVPLEDWIEYKSDDEHGKYAYNKAMPEACSLILSLLTSDAMAQMCGCLAGIDKLRPDPSLYGGGIHRTEPGGFLGLHLDNEQHPKTGLIRRLNLIIYLTKEWEDAWGGHLELWDVARSSPETKILPAFGRTVIFETGAHSYHGHTKPLSCPTGVSRKSIAVYYWSEPRSRARFLSSEGESQDDHKETRRLARSIRK